MTDGSIGTQGVTQSPSLRYAQPSLLRSLFLIGFTLAEAALLLAALLVWQTPAAQSLASDVAQAAETMVEATRDPNPSRPTAPTGVGTQSQSVTTEISPNSLARQQSAISQSPSSSSIAAPVIETIPAIFAPDQANETLVSSGPILLAETLERMGLLPTRVSVTSSTVVTSALPPLTDEPANPKIATDLGIAATGWQTITTEGFENAFPNTGWDIFDNNGATGGDVKWGDTSARSYAGNWSAWPAGRGANARNPSNGDQYPNNADSWLRYGPFDLSNATQAELQFRLWSKTEPTNDKIYWIASGNGTNFSGYYTTGDTGGWTQKTLNLADAYGQNFLGDSSVWIAFKFESNGSITNVGPFIDEVVIRKFVPTAAITEVTFSPTNRTVDPGQRADYTAFVGVDTPQAGTLYVSLTGTNGINTWSCRNNVSSSTQSVPLTIGEGTTNGLVPTSYPLNAQVIFRPGGGTCPFNSSQPGDAVWSGQNVATLTIRPQSDGSINSVTFSPSSRTVTTGQSTSYSAAVGLTANRSGYLMAKLSKNGVEAVDCQWISGAQSTTRTLTLSFSGSQTQTLGVGTHPLTGYAQYSATGSCPFTANYPNEATWGPYTNQAQLIINPVNQPPSISNPSITPSSGGPNTDFVFEITYSDSDNDLPNPRQVFVGTNAYDMTEVDSGDTNVRDGKRYRLTTRLSIGSYNTNFRFNDGVIGHSDATSYHPGVPVVENRPPSRVTNPSPVDGRTDVAPGAIELSWSPASDPDGDTVNYDLRWGYSRSDLSNGGSIGTNPRYTLPLSIAGSTWIYWRVDSQDGTTTVTGDVWSFKTKPETGFTFVSWAPTSQTVEQLSPATVSATYTLTITSPGVLMAKLNGNGGQIIGTSCEAVNSSGARTTNVTVPSTMTSQLGNFPLNGSLQFRPNANLSECPFNTTGINDLLWPPSTQVVSTLIIESPTPPTLTNPTFTPLTGAVVQGQSFTVDYAVGISTSGPGVLSTKLYDPTGTVVGSDCVSIGASQNRTGSVSVSTTNATPNTTYPLRAEMIFRRNASLGACPLAPTSDPYTAVWSPPGFFSQVDVFSATGFWFEQLNSFNGTWSDQEKDSFARTVSLEAAAADYLVKTASIAWGIPNYDALVQQAQTGQVGAPHVRRAFPLVIKNIASRGEPVVIETDAGFTVRAISIGDQAIQGNEINVGSSETLRIVVHLEPPLGFEAGQVIPFRFRARLKDSQIVLATSDEKRISFVPLTQYLAGAYNCTTSFFVDGATSILNLVTDTGKFALDSAYYYGPSSLVSYAYDPDGYLSGVTAYNQNIATFFGGLVDQVTNRPIEFAGEVADAIILENVRTAYDDSASGCSRAKAVGSIGVDVGLFFVGEGVVGKVTQITSQLAARGFVVKNIVTHGDDFLKITVATKADDGKTVVKSLKELLDLGELPKVTKQIVADPRVTARLAAAPAKVQWAFFEDVASSRAVKLLSTTGDDAAIDAYLRILERELSHPAGSGFELSLRTAAAKLVPESGPAALSADEFSQFVRAVDYFQAERVTGIDKALRLVGQQGGDGSDAVLRAQALSRAKRVVDGTRQNPLSIEHDVRSLTDIDLVSVDLATSRYYFTEIKSGGRLDVVRDSTTGRYRLKADLGRQLQTYDRIRNNVDLRRQAGLIGNVPPDNIYLRLTADPATIVVPNVDDAAERLRILREVLRRDYGMTTEFVPSIKVGKDAQAEDQGTLFIYDLYETRLSPAHVLTNDGQSPYSSATQQLTLSGLVDPRATTVQLNGETVSPTSQADGSKIWSYPTTLWHGQNNYSIVAEGSGLTSSEPITFIVSWDAGPLVAPTITTNGGNSFATATSPVTIEGTVPPRLYETIQANGSTNPITSYDADTGLWQASVALASGPNVVSVTGVTRAGDSSPADSITVTLNTSSAVQPTVTSIEYLSDTYQEPGWLNVRLRGTKQVGDAILVNGQVPNNLSDAGNTWALETSINVGAWLFFTDDPNRFEFTARRGSTTSAATTVRFPYSSTLSGSATPGGGTFAGPTSVALSATATITVTSTIDDTAGPSRVYTPSAKAIHYTTDGSLPTPSSPAYTTPITLNTTTTLRFLALHPARLGDRQFQEVYTITPTDTDALDEPSFETTDVWRTSANGFQVRPSNLWASDGSQSMRIDNPGTTLVGWFGEFWQQVDLASVGAITFDAKGYFGDNDLSLWAGSTRLWQSDGVDHQWTHHTVTVPLPSDLSGVQTLKFRYAVRNPGNGNIWAAVDNLRLTRVQILTMTIADGQNRTDVRDWTKAFVKLYRAGNGQLVAEGHASPLGDGTKGTIEFPRIESGAYTADIFYEDTTWGARGEHWGNPLDIVVGESDTTYDFVRHEPAVSAVTLTTSRQVVTPGPDPITVRRGEPVTVSALVRNGKSISAPGTAVELLIRPQDGDPIALPGAPAGAKAGPVELDPGETREMQITFVPDVSGLYQLALKTYSRVPEELTDWLTWGQLPAPTIRVVDELPTPPTVDQLRLSPDDLNADQVILLAAGTKAAGTTVRIAGAGVIEVINAETTWTARIVPEMYVIMDFRSPIWTYTVTAHQDRQVSDPVTFTAAVEARDATLWADPPGGTYSITQSVTLSGTETVIFSGTISGRQFYQLTVRRIGTIHYTTDGSDPNIASPIRLPIVISVDTVLKFAGRGLQGTLTPIRTETYRITAPRPIITVSSPGGTYAEEVTVILTATNPTDTIYYTTDGTQPTTSSARYATPFRFIWPTTLRAVAVDGSGQGSEVVTERYELTRAITLAANQWTMLAPPSRLPVANLGTGAVVYAWLQNEGRYAAVTDALTPDVGYWVRVPTERTLTLAVDSRTMWETSRLAAPRGWVLLAPFWLEHGDRVLVSDGATTLPVRDAIGRGWLHATGYQWSGTDYGRIPIADQIGVQPRNGGALWVYLTRPMTLSFDGASLAVSDRVNPSIPALPDADEKTRLRIESLEPKPTG